MPQDIASDKRTDKGEMWPTQPVATAVVFFMALFVAVGLGTAVWAVWKHPPDEPQWVIVGATLCYVGITAWLGLSAWGAASLSAQTVREMRESREKQYEALASWLPVALKQDSYLVVHIRNLTRTPMLKLIVRAWRLGQRGPIHERYTSSDVNLAAYERVPIYLSPVTDDTVIPLGPDMQLAQEALALCQREASCFVPLPNWLLCLLQYEDALGRLYRRAFVVTDHLPVQGAPAETQPTCEPTSGPGGAQDGPCEY